MSIRQATFSTFVSGIPNEEAFTGDFISVTVTHVADLGQWMPGYVLLSVAPPAPVSVPDELSREEYKRLFMEEDNFDDTFRGGWNACRAALLQGAELVTTANKLPDGYVLVPVEPTEEMIAAAMCSNDVLFDKEDDTLFRVQHGEIWRAMLSTAPEQEAK